MEPIFRSPFHHEFDGDEFLVSFLFPSEENNKILSSFGPKSEKSLNVLHKFHTKIAFV